VEIYKSRTEPKQLTLLRVLNTRSNLTEEEKKYLQNLDKGFQGEREFDLLTSKIQSECIIINDLLLEVNNSEFQIDTVMFYKDTIYLNDVKNMEGDYCYTPEALKTIHGGEYKNPLHQLQRSKTLLKQLLHKLGYNVNIEGYVVFINPEFMLYLTPPDLPFVFPAHVKRFLQKFEVPSKITHTHKKMAETLVSLHKVESNHSRRLKYEYKSVRKGCTCLICHTFNLRVVGSRIVCLDCGNSEKLTSFVIRMIAEIQLLFPERKITTNEVYEWTGRVVTKRRLREILGKHYKANGYGQWTYYE
jgi:hypothetical protein